MLTLQETRCVHDSMNRPKLNFLLHGVDEVLSSLRSKDSLKAYFENVNIYKNEDD